MGLEKRLKKLRLAKGLTQKELAEPHYTHAYVSTIEAGRRQPSRSALEHFADRLGVDVEELRTGRPPDLEAKLDLALHEARQDTSAGRYDEAETKLKQIAKDSRRYELYRLEARARYASGLVLERRGRLQEAIEVYEEAEGMLEGAPLITSVDPLAGRARCLQMLGETRYGIHLLESRVDLLHRQKLTDPAALVRLWSSLAFLYMASGLYGRASEAAAQALQLAPRVRDHEQLANMHMNVARVLLAEGRIADAEESLKRAEEMYRSLDFLNELGAAHIARGIVLSRRGDLDDARRELELALEVFDEAPSRLDHARALNELGRVERLAGDVETARTLLRRSIDLLQDTDVGELGLAHRELALCEAEDNPSKAESELKKAITLFEKADETVELAATYRALGDLMELRGEESKRCDAYRTGILAIEERLQGPVG